MHTGPLCILLSDFSFICLGLKSHFWSLCLCLLTKIWRGHSVIKPARNVIPAQCEDQRGKGFSQGHALSKHDISADLPSNRSSDSYPNLRRGTHPTRFEIVWHFYAAADVCVHEWNSKVLIFLTSSAEQRQRAIKSLKHISHPTNNESVFVMNMRRHEIDRSTGRAHFLAGGFIMWAGAAMGFKKV